MVSCARATRGLRRPSLDTRSGRLSSPPSREQVGCAHGETVLAREKSASRFVVLGYLATISRSSISNTNVAPGLMRGGRPLSR